MPTPPKFLSEPLARFHVLLMQCLWISERFLFSRSSLRRYRKLKFLYSHSIFPKNIYPCFQSFGFYSTSRNTDHATSTVPKRFPSTWTPPPHCPGCGAPSQQLETTLPGYYSPKPKRPSEFNWAGLEKSAGKRGRRDKRDEDLWRKALAGLEGNEKLQKELGIDINRNKHKHFKTQSEEKPNLRSPPVCQRCHYIVYEHRAPPLPAYATLDTLTELILASPHENHHVYHLVDAADFPLSLILNLRSHLNAKLPNDITRNLTVSYIITRCDLLMPKKEYINSLMTYLKSTLKDFLPPDERVEGLFHINTKIHAIASRTGWDIGILKQEIKERQGGIWFLGAVNVGKSSLMRQVWPEGGELKLVPTQDASVSPDDSRLTFQTSDTDENDQANYSKEGTEKKVVSADSSRSTSFQVAPTISEVPGTTAAPLRIIYKTSGMNGKSLAELVDLPGLERWTGFGDSGLAKYVRPNRLRSLTMQSRVRASQYTIKDGQSLLLGGLVLITPKNLGYNNVMLANPFTPLPEHITATRKCINFLSQQDPYIQGEEKLFNLPFQINSENPPESDEIVLPKNFMSAGIFSVSQDVTTKRNPVLQSTSTATLNLLPYKVLGSDILLEGIGWVELSVQVRTRHMPDVPVIVEVFTPEGKGVGQRKTMGAYMMLEKGARLVGLRTTHVRPRLSKKGEKKNQKRISRGLGS